MASEVQQGKAIIFGITNNGTAITMTGVATFILDSVKGQHNFDVDEIRDENNFTASVIASEMHEEIDVQWTPSAATRALAAGTAAYPVALSKVTLANFAVDQFNGDYQYRPGASIDLGKKDAKMSIKLRKWQDSDQNASLTTTVSG